MVAWKCEISLLALKKYFNCSRVQPFNILCLLDLNVFSTFKHDR